MRAQRVVSELIECELVAPITLPLPCELRKILATEIVALDGISAECFTGQPDRAWSTLPSGDGKAERSVGRHLTPEGNAVYPCGEPRGNGSHLPANLKY
jgi:hypothetical protein